MSIPLLKNNVVQMKSTGNGMVTSVGIQISSLGTTFSLAGNLVMDADTGLNRTFQYTPYSRADYEATNQFLRCIKNVDQW